MHTLTCKRGDVYKRQEYARIIENITLCLKDIYLWGWRNFGILGSNVEKGILKNCLLFLLFCEALIGLVPLERGVRE